MQIFSFLTSETITVLDFREGRIWKKFVREAGVVKA